jgi:putative Holliday junction resolvase
MPATNEAIICLDVGSKRIGVAIATLAARLPRPLTTLQNDEAFMTHVQQIIAEQAVQAIVVGLPRGLSGQETAQTAIVQQFAADLGAAVQLPIHYQDEALTSVAAETELEERGGTYIKGDIDALAATYILQDYLDDMAGVW